MNDLMMLRGMDSKEGLSPYEQVKLDHMTAKSHTGGVAVAGLVTGVAGVTIAATAWLFGGMYSNAKAKEAKETAIAAKEIATLQNGATQRQLDQLTQLLAAERNERIQGDVTLTNTVNDSVSGSQSGQLTALQQAELAASQATQQVMTQTYSDFVTGRASLEPDSRQPVLGSTALCLSCQRLRLRRVKVSCRRRFCRRLLPFQNFTAI